MVGFKAIASWCKVCQMFEFAKGRVSMGKICHRCGYADLFSSKVSVLKLLFCYILELKYELFDKIYLK